MRREDLYEPYTIEFATVNEGSKKAHKHSFFELVYIVEGTGVQCINKNQFDYHQGHLFLITPEDCHSFDVATPTTFFSFGLIIFLLPNPAFPPIIFIN